MRDIPFSVSNEYYLYKMKKYIDGYKSAYADAIRLHIYLAENYRGPVPGRIPLAVTRQDEKINRFVDRLGEYTAFKIDSNMYDLYQDLCLEYFSDDIQCTDDNIPETIFRLLETGKAPILVSSKNIENVQKHILEGNGCDVVSTDIWYHLKGLVVDAEIFGSEITTIETSYRNIDAVSYFERFVAEPKKFIAEKNGYNRYEFEYKPEQPKEEYVLLECDMQEFGKYIEEQIVNRALIKVENLIRFLYSATENPLIFNLPSITKEDRETRRKIENIFTINPPAAFGTTFYFRELNNLKGDYEKAAEKYREYLGAKEDRQYYRDISVLYECVNRHVTSLPISSFHVNSLIPHIADDCVRQDSPVQKVDVKELSARPKKILR